MAIKERKIPSPSDIKKTPQAFSKEELDQLISLRDKINQLTFQFGQISLSRIKLEEEEKIVKDKLNSLSKEEKKIAESLSNKYGNGTIDLVSGTFIPVE